MVGWIFIIIGFGRIGVFKLCRVFKNEITEIKNIIESKVY